MDSQSVPAALNPWVNYMFFDPSGNIFHHLGNAFKKALNGQVANVSKVVVHLIAQAVKKLGEKFPKALTGCGRSRGNKLHQVCQNPAPVNTLDRLGNVPANFSPVGSRNSIACRLQNAPYQLAAVHGSL